MSGTVSCMLDSGASCHMAGDVFMMDMVEKIATTAIGLPNGTYTMASEKGSVALGEGLKLAKVICVCKFNCFLVSVSKLCKQLNCTITYFDYFCVIQDHTSRTLIGLCEQRDDVHYYKDTRPRQANAVNARCLWHRHLGHPSSEVLSFLPHSVGTVRSKGENKDDICEISCYAKQTRNQILFSKNNAKNFFDLIHCDIWGPYGTPSSCGAHYFLSIVDDASQATGVYLMKDRTKMGKLLKEFIVMVQAQFNSKVKVFQSDNCSKFTSGTMKEFYSKRGILRESSCMDIPQQNGRVERKHRHILNMASRGLRFQAHLPIQFWRECLLNATYLINRTPTKLLKGKSPYGLLYACKPSQYGGNPIM